MAENVIATSVADSINPRFLIYAQSVIQNRALPSAFDGLKPIHRRVLMSFYDNKLFSNVQHRKSAKTVGICISVYSPHGDMSAYDALVGMAQDFTMRYPLVDGSGNYGSLNGESPAAMRYTESRLSPFGELMLNKVEILSEMKPNFDNSGKEPIDLPSYFPNLLLNGTSGIAVGLATKIPSHYSRDIYDALIKCIDGRIKDKEVTADNIIDIIKAPDFPTGASIINGSDMREMYKSGKGTVTLRSRYKIEKNNIIYTDVPYKVTPDSIVMAIASLEIPDIKDVRDESSIRNGGVRIVVELKKDANPEWIINRLFKSTPLQSNYSVNMTMIMDNKPVQNVSIDRIFNYYLDNIEKIHKKDIDIQLKDLQKKSRNLNAIKTVIENIDDFIRIVRNEENPVSSIESHYEFTREEAEYVYGLKISSISKASEEDISKKISEITTEIERLSEIVGDKTKFLTDIKNKFKTIRDSKLFKNDCRRTEILNITSDSSDMKTFVKNEPVIVTYSNKGMIKAIRPTEYKANRRNAVGTKTKSLREDEIVTNMLALNTHDDLLLLTDLGRCYIVPVYKIPIGNRNSMPKSINNYITLNEDERVLSIIGIPKESDNDNNVVFVTKFGYIKRISLKDLIKGRASTIGTRAIVLSDGDKIKGTIICDDNSDIVIFTSHGRGLMFNIDDEDKPLRSMGKMARGVLAVKLKSEEYVVNSSLMQPKNSIVLITTLGYMKRMDYKSFKKQKRNQTPINYMSKIDKVGYIVDGITVTENQDLLITTKFGQTLRCDINSISTSSRTASGVKCIRIKDDNDIVVSVSSVDKEDEIELEKE